VALARDFPELDVGLHLAMVEESALLPSKKLPTLVDRAGRLPRTKGEFCKRALLGRLNWDEVEAEIAAQITRFQQTGLKLSHVDSHQHLHMLPAVFEMVTRLTGGMNHVWIRNPAGPWRKPRGIRMGRWFQRLGLNMACLWARGLHNPPSLRMPDGMYGFEVAGSLTRSALEQIIREIPDGLYELSCHPGEEDEESRRQYGHWGYQWAGELDAVTATETRRLLQEQNITLTSFAQA
jgi:predicted glycoside hydrolase/deacetylase ChbG (UPF0249 family)